MTYVKPVFIIHVGGTRCVTSSTDNIMKIHARITLNVEFIRGYIFIFLFYVNATIVPAVVSVPAAQTLITAKGINAPG